MLLQGDPIASEALGEFNRPDLAGSFFAWPSDGDIERFQRAAGDNNHYIAGNIPLFNYSTDLREEPQLRVGLYVFEPESNTAFNNEFYSAYAGHVGLLKWAYGEGESDSSADEIEKAKYVRRGVFDETTRSLASQGRRLIGGYAIMTSVDSPKEYIGFVFGAKELYERYQFVARDATLKGFLEDQPEELKRRRLLLLDDPEIGDATHGHIVRKLVSVEKVAERLGVEISAD